MACCMTAPSHYLNHSWLGISDMHHNEYEYFISNKNTLETCKNPRPTSGWSEPTKSCITSTMNFHMAYFSWIPQDNARLRKRLGWKRWDIEINFGKRMFIHMIIAYNNQNYNECVDTHVILILEKRIWLMQEIYEHNQKMLSVQSGSFVQWVRTIAILKQIRNIFTCIFPSLHTEKKCHNGQLRLWHC